MKKGFFSSLFDLSFTSFVTPKLVAILFVLVIVLGAISAIAIMVSGSEVPGSWGGLAVIIGLLIFVLVLIYARVVLELMVIVFRISENVALLAGVQPPGAVAGAAQAPEPFPPYARASPAAPASTLAYALSGGDTVENLTRLKALLDAGSITRDDFDREKTRLLSLR